ncbi:heme-binding protein [uncultured Thiodictyon sp.]|uniref:GlcG/HbpS family heme-binding protein n=1 Tax=uncultured Thiodictyon sp. TaxID=1846217 RepID=UPI0025DC1539|nr:heme-binding protein [uncultured Thiodictyon sp.]
MTKTLCAAAAALLIATPALAEDPLLVQVRHLSMGAALKIAEGAIAACRDKGFEVAATVVDRDGGVQVTLRDTLVAPLMADLSAQKAKTAVHFSGATSAMHERANSALGHADGVLMAAGGVPVLVGGTALVAGLGVSGSPAGETDEECALAGIAKVQEELDRAQ